MFSVDNDDNWFLDNFKQRSKQTLTRRFMAVDAAALTRPSISAPLKFFVAAAKSTKSTSDANLPLSRMRAVWIRSIWPRPFSSGNPAAAITTKTVSWEDDLYTTAKAKIFTNFTETTSTHYTCHTRSDNSKDDIV